jgi:hypothetical protein
MNEREKRFVLTMGIIIAVIAAIALFGYLSGAWDAAS